MERKYIDSYVEKWVRKHMGKGFKSYYCEFPHRTNANSNGIPMWAAKVGFKGVATKKLFTFVFYSTTTIKVIVQ